MACLKRKQVNVLLSVYFIYMRQCHIVHIHDKNIVISLAHGATNFCLDKWPQSPPLPLPRPQQKIKIKMHDILSVGKLFSAASVFTIAMFRFQLFYTMFNNLKVTGSDHFKIQME